MIMTPTKFEKKTSAIVKFGPATSTDGMRPAEYYAVTIDPEKVTQSGEFIRFGDNQGDELIGWQRCAAMTVVEIIGEWQEGIAGKDQKFQLGVEPPVINVASAETE